jgi:hypothetical protein
MGSAFSLLLEALKENFCPINGCFCPIKDFIFEPTTNERLLNSDSLNTSSMKKIVEVVLHLLFWFLMLVGFPYSGYLSMLKSGYDPGPFVDFWLASGPLNLNPPIPVLLAGFYLLYFVTSYGLQRKWTFRAGVYLLWSLLILIPTGMVLLGTEDFVCHYVMEIYYFIVMSTMGLLAGALKGGILRMVGLSEKRLLKKRQLESENALLLLKAQLNPHFLFNSLNNIDILIEESPRIASEYLKKLSDILRYVLYETKGDETTLKREIEQITHYIELQKIRTANASYVDFDVLGPVGDQRIVPMIFLPFVENAFKFSTNKLKEHAIAIRFEVSPTEVEMTCRNYYEEQRLRVIRNEGLGIETIRQRLKLLYPGKHRLTIEKEEHWFTVTLNIALGWS